MKFLFLAFSLIPFFSYSQYAGEYCLGAGFSGFCVTILPKNKFTYSYADDCSYGKAGIGHYNLSHIRLILHFEKDTTPQKSDIGKIMIQELLPEDSNLSKIELFITDEKDTSPLISATIQEKISDKSTGRGVVTDINGHAILSLPRWYNKAVQISYVGYKSIDIPINSLKDYKIKCNLKQHMPIEIPAGTVYTFKIKNKSKKGFDLVVANKHDHYRKTLASK